MTVVEANVGGMKLSSPDNCDILTDAASHLLIEGIAQNTTGNVFVPEVSCPISHCNLYSYTFKCNGKDGNVLKNIL